jgi:hypothetical protein
MFIFLTQLINGIRLNFMKNKLIIILQMGFLLENHLLSDDDICTIINDDSHFQVKSVINNIRLAILNDDDTFDTILEKLHSF